MAGLGPSSLGLGLPMGVATPSSGSFSQGSALPGSGGSGAGGPGYGTSGMTSAGYGTNEGYPGMGTGLLAPGSGSASGPGSASASISGTRRVQGPSSISQAPNAPHGASRPPSGRSELVGGPSSSGGGSRSAGNSQLAADTAENGRERDNILATGVTGTNTGAGGSQAGDNGKNEKTEWVMWVGNVPSDATREELYTFFGSASGNGGAGGAVRLFYILQSFIG